MATYSRDVTDDALDDEIASRRTFHTALTRFRLTWLHCKAKWKSGRSDWWGVLQGALRVFTTPGPVFVYFYIFVFVFVFGASAFWANPWGGIRRFGDVVGKRTV